MQSGNPPDRSLFVPASLFILGFFFLFSYDGLNTYFNFDDGMNLLAMHHQWEIPLWRNVVEVLKVFTTANRPLGALFYRPMYTFFGFNPYPYRVVVYIFLVFNIILAHRFARALGATREAAALSTLLFCYNAALLELYYSTGTIYDVLCFPLFFGALLLYVRERSTGQLRPRTMVVVMLLFLAALDAKEMAVLLPVHLVFYELLYRREDFRSRQLLAHIGGFLAVLGVVTAIFLKVKVTDMANNQLYHPTLSVPVLLTGMGHYFEVLLYLKQGSLGAVQTAIVILALLGASLAARSRTAVFGTLLFVAGLLPISLIPPRGGYAAYVAFPGLTLALGAILDAARSALLRLTGKEQWQRAGTIALFLGVAVFSVKSFAHIRKVTTLNILWNQQRVIGLLDAFHRQVPEFPPNARVLILDDPWGPDWGPMFLTRLSYHDPTIWIDRVKNPEKPGDRDTYDLLVTYKIPFIEMFPDKLFGIKMNWEIHARSKIQSELLITAPTESRAPRNLEFSPPAVRTGRPVTLTVPGVSNVQIDVVYRVLSNGKSTSRVAEHWCTLDAKGTCTVNAPPVEHMGALSIDWIRRPNERWIFTTGVLTVVE